MAQSHATDSPKEAAGYRIAQAVLARSLTTEAEVRDRIIHYEFATLDHSDQHIAAVREEARKALVAAGRTEHSENLTEAELYVLDPHLVHRGSSHSEDDDPWVDHPAAS